MLMVQWTFGNVACKLFKFLEMTALHGSSYVVVLIAQNRWVAVSHPLASRRSRPSSPRSVLFVWILGACASIPQIFLFSVQEGPFYEQYYQCVTYDVGATSERVYNLVNFITLFVAPLMGLIVSYLSIYCTLSKGQREIRSVNKISIATYDQNRQRRLKRAMVKSRWIAAVIVCAYLVFWLPYYITMLVYFLAPAQWYNSKWMEWIFFCGMVNSVVNPAIYGLFQLWKPKRQNQWSVFRQRDGSTQLTQFTDSFRRHGVVGATPADAAAPEQSTSGATTSSSASVPAALAEPPPTPPAQPAPPAAARAARAVPGGGGLGAGRGRPGGDPDAPGQRRGPQGAQGLRHRRRCRSQHPHDGPQGGALQLAEPIPAQVQGPARAHGSPGAHLTGAPWPPWPATSTRTSQHGPGPVPWSCCQCSKNHHACKEAF
ncbi:hypothetical protein ONE63_000819 [Megalurothrips usitatus]|uniref:G-protein coupled receptors family 1 profile domain-containing protein n=1 Tax=Megalurothrips usitatus TaxID=439358 RepID=A0AAV7XZP2_9NEOP|nr:hypothetical protein ONE63_000819 [Megalurothrips usitatus]